MIPRRAAAASRAARTLGETRSPRRAFAAVRWAHGASLLRATAPGCAVRRRFGAGFDFFEASRSALAFARSAAAMAFASARAALMASR